jgi:hypothetical protein
MHKQNDILSSLSSQAGASLAEPIELPSGKPTQHLGYVLIVPVWGDHHTDLFLRYCIPFLLTDGNIGAFPNRKLKVHIASRRSDFARMHENANYRALAAATELIETEIDDVVDLSVPHRAMTECYLQVFRKLPRPGDTVTILPTPDCILSRNAFKKIVELIESGWRAVMVCGLRLTLETAGPLLDQMVARPKGAGGVSERELCSAVLDNLHPITLSCDVASNEFMVEWPSHVYWIAPDRSWLVGQCFHLHPLAVRGIPDAIDVDTTIDGDYLMGLGVDASQLYVCADSDELFCVELSPRAKRILKIVGRLTARKLVRFSLGCNPLHVQFFARSIRWRGLREPQIPERVARQSLEFGRALKRGSKAEELRHAALLTLRRHPRLKSAARLVLYWGHRLVGRNAARWSPDRR